MGVLLLHRKKREKEERERRERERELWLVTWCYSKRIEGELNRQLKIDQVG